MSQNAIPIRNNNEELIQSANQISNRSINQNQSLMKTYLSTFTYLFFLNFSIFTIIYLLMALKFIYVYNFNLCDWPIRLKKQYYRTLTHNLVHKNLLHYVYASIFYYYVATKLEKKLGTLMACVMTYFSVFTISLLFIALSKLLSLVVINYMKFREFNLDFYSTCGYAPVCFSLFYVICTFESSLVIDYIRFNGQPVNSRYLPFIFLIIIQILNHESSFVGHLSGILTGMIIKNICIYFIFPSKEVLSHFEIQFSGIVHAAKEHFNYVDVLSVDERDFKEIDKHWCDFPLFKFFINSFRERCHQYTSAREINITEMNESRVNVNNVNEGNESDR